jgi:hypothetical protein
LAGEAVSRLKSDELPLEVTCVWSNIGDEFIAEAYDVDAKKWVAHGTGQTRPEALRELADALEAMA